MIQKKNMKRQSKEQKHIKMQSKHFEIKENQLYKKDKRQQGHLLKVLQKHELESILFLIYNHPTGGHFRTDIMFNKLEIFIIGRKCIKIFTNM